MFERDLVLEIQDLRYLKWDKCSSVAGSFLKAEEITNGMKIYYKLSNFDSVKGIVGHECINELIVDRLLNVLGVHHLHYQLIRALVLVDDKEYETYLCASENFKEKGDRKIAFDEYYGLNRLKGESIFDFVKRNNFDNYIYIMLVIDYLIINRDRHGANIEILSSNNKIKFAPLFDHGLSLLFSVKEEKEVKEFDALKNYPCNNYVGSRNSYENLKLIPKDKKPVFRPLKEEDKTYIFDGLEDILSNAYLDKIWEIIWKRWNVYEDM